MEIKSALCHTLLYDAIKPQLSFDEKQDFQLWRKQIKQKLLELTGIDNIAKKCLSVKRSNRE